MTGHIQYDEAKLIEAFNLWIETCVEFEAGHTCYGGTLLEDFEDFVFSKDLLRRSPGRVAFGRMMTTLVNQDLVDRYRKADMIHYAGIKLLSGRSDAPPRYQAPIDASPYHATGPAEDAPKYATVEEEMAALRQRVEEFVANMGEDDDGEP